MMEVTIEAAGVGDGAVPVRTVDVDDQPGRFGVRRRLRRRLERRALLIVGLRILVVAGALVAWQSGRFIDPYYVSSPTEVWNVLWRWVTEGVLWDNLFITIQEALLGFALGALIGMTFGFVLGLTSIIRQVFTPIVMVLNAIPKLALVPLFIMWFGLGLQSKIALVTIVIAFLVFYNTYAGVRDVNRELIDSVRLMGGTRRTLWIKVMAPSALTWIITGFRVSIPYAIVAAVTAELIASNRGMGYLLTRSAGQFNSAGVFAVLIVLMVFASVLNGVLNLVERRFLAWKRTGEAA